MTEKIASALDAIIQAANHKATNYAIAAGLVVTGQTAKEASAPEFKSLSDIPVTELFAHDLSAAAVASLVGSAWIIFQFSREIIRGIVWLWGRYRERKN